MDIGHRMKELRIQYGLTQQELADRAELTKGFISQLERNQNSPSVGTLLDIIQCLGMTPAEFFTDSEPEQIVYKANDYFEKIDDEKTARWNGSFQTHRPAPWSLSGSLFIRVAVLKYICLRSVRSLDM